MVSEVGVNRFCAIMNFCTSAKINIPAVATAICGQCRWCRDPNLSSWGYSSQYK
jgi:hypothetical protein